MSDGEERNPAIEWARTVVATLVGSGVDHFCVCPGARSGPLVFAVAERDDIRASLHFDERVAGFFALGAARRLGRPVALVSTSGSAVANFAPAVVEANLSAVPLVLLTADRPPELRQNGAPQAIDQTHIFGRHVRWFVDLETPHADARGWLPQAVARAAACAAGPHPGPVHVNVPFRKPLEPLPGDRWPAPLSPINGRRRAVAVAGELPNEILRMIEGARRPLVVVGAEPLPAEDADAVCAWARSSDVPVLADALSGIRGRESICGHAEAILKRGGFAALEPDLVVRVGPLPTSKAWRLWNAALSCPQVVFDRAARWRDPLEHSALFVDGPIRSIAAAEPTVAAGWAEGWFGADEAVRRLLEATGEMAEVLPIEPLGIAAVFQATRVDDPVHVASSMPIRDVDLVMQGARDVTASRGSNGIDGTFSTGFGSAWVLRGTGRQIVIAGDVAALHDIGGLAAASAPVAGDALKATIVIVNNDGGGIFGFLPLAEHQRVLDPWFRTPHGMSFEGAATQYGHRYERVESVIQLRQAVQDATDATATVVIEWVVDPNADNVGAYGRFWDAAHDAVKRALDALEPA